MSKGSVGNQETLTILLPEIIAQRLNWPPPGRTGRLPRWSWISWIETCRGWNRPRNAPPYLSFPPLSRLRERVARNEPGEGGQNSETLGLHADFPHPRPLPRAPTEGWSGEGSLVGCLHPRGFFPRRNACVQARTLRCIEPTATETIYPGGQPSERPPSRCRCRCQTAWPASAPQLITMR